MKYTTDMKLQWVDEYINSRPISFPESINTSAKRHNFMSHIREWAKLFRRHGVCGLQKHEQKVFTLDEKVAAITRVKNGEPKMSVSSSLEIAFSVLNNWIKVYSKLGLDGLKSLGTRRGRPPMKKKQECKPNSVNLTDEEKKTFANAELMAENEALREKLRLAELEVKLLKKVKALLEDSKEEDPER